ncbi:MAG: hypothetical protein IT339_00140 [Thermomicrobiales bacterium]|nr:hypothetical protein [Thermomicrobiales bacterium]
MTQFDVIDTILGEDAAAAVADLRAQKPELATQMQAYYETVFDPTPESAAALSPAERFAAAIRTASHTGSTNVVSWYSNQAVRTDVPESVIAAALELDSIRSGNDRLDAILRHVDLVTARPVESRRDDIEALSEAGLSPIGIVALSQVIAYVSYQLRLVATLRALGGSK